MKFKIKFNKGESIFDYIIVALIGIALMWYPELSMDLLTIIVGSILLLTGAVKIFELTKKK